MEGWRIVQPLLKGLHEKMVLSLIGMKSWIPKRKNHHCVWIRWLYIEYNFKFQQEMNTEDGVPVKGGSMSYPYLQLPWVKSNSKLKKKLTNQLLNWFLNQLLNRFWIPVKLNEGMLVWGSWDGRTWDRIWGKATCSICIFVGTERERKILCDKRKEKEKNKGKGLRLVRTR